MVKVFGCLEGSGGVGVVEVCESSSGQVALECRTKKENECGGTVNGETWTEPDEVRWYTEKQDETMPD